MADELVIYLLVRNDLKMNRGEIVIECCNALQEILFGCTDNETMINYLAGANTKIICKVHSREQMNQIIVDCQRVAAFYEVIVVDNEVLSVGVGPIRRALAPTSIKKLKQLT